jgi:hypothetical protein
VALGSAKIYATRWETGGFRILIAKTSYASIIPPVKLIVKTERQRQALIGDLQKLQSEIPELIAAIELGNQEKTDEAVALLIHGSSGRSGFLMNKLTDLVIAESAKGNSRPLRMIASGEIFGR